MEHRIEIFADYFQFYLRDDDFGFGEQPQDWNGKAVERMIVTGLHLIGGSTARNMTVPVAVRFLIAGCTDYFPDAARIELAPGTYNALIGYKASAPSPRTGWTATTATTSSCGGSEVSM